MTTVGIILNSLLYIDIKHFLSAEHFQHPHHQKEDQVPCYPILQGIQHLPLGICCALYMKQLYVELHWPDHIPKDVEDNATSPLTDQMFSQSEYEHDLICN